MLIFSSLILSDLPPFSSHPPCVLCPHQGQVLLPNCCQMCPPLETQSTYQRLYKLSEKSTLSPPPAENYQWSLGWGSNLIPNLYLHAWILSGLNLHRSCVWFIHVVNLYVQLPCCVRKCGFVAVIHQLSLILFFLPFFYNDLQAFHLGLGILQSLTLFALVSSGVCLDYHLQQMEVSLMSVEWGLKLLE